MCTGRAAWNHPGALWPPSGRGLVEPGPFLAVGGIPEDRLSAPDYRTADRLLGQVAKTAQAEFGMCSAMPRGCTCNLRARALFLVHAVPRTGTGVDDFFCAVLASCQAQGPTA